MKLKDICDMWSDVDGIEGCEECESTYYGPCARHISESMQRVAKDFAENVLERSYEHIHSHDFSWNDLVKKSIQLAEDDE